MLTTELFEHLCVLAEKVGYTVRLERLPGQGGVCELKGRQLLFIDTTQELDEQIEQVARVIASHPGLAAQDIHPTSARLLQEFGAQLGETDRH